MERQISPDRSFAASIAHGDDVLTDDCGAESRIAPRFGMLIRPAKLIAGDAEFLCVLRDASATGIAAKLFHPLPEGETFELETLGGKRYSVTTVWEKEGSAGFRFSEPIDIEAFVSEKARFPRRPIRLRLELDGRTRSLGRPGRVRIGNLSQNGALIFSNHAFVLGQKLELSAHPLPQIHCTVRWVSEGAYGVSFSENYQLPDLARFLARVHGLMESRP